MCCRYLVSNWSVLIKKTVIFLRYSEQEPIMNNCEECFVMPEELLQMMVDRMLALGEDRKEAKKKIKTYLEGRRTTQGHMAMVNQQKLGNWSVFY